MVRSLRPFKQYAVTLQRDDKLYRKERINIRKCLLNETWTRKPSERRHQLDGKRLMQIGEPE